jgi:hypothetical protein
VEKTLAEQLQEMLETLTVAESQAAAVQATMGEQHIFLGLEYSDLNGDLMRFTWRVRHMKRLAELRSNETSS